MKVKAWGIMAVAGFGAMLMSSFLLPLGLPRTLAQVLVIAGAAALFGGLIGILVWGCRHPLRCPACGAGLDPRYLRQPGGGVRLTGRETMQCPRCGAMFLPQNLRRDSD